jgi:transcriptional regulator with XRE-family HTH domain
MNEGKGQGSGRGRGRLRDLERSIGAKVREHRLLLGMTQQQLAEALGMTYQQVHKYETGTNRIASGQLGRIAQVLGVEIGQFFADAEREEAFRPTPSQRLLLELTRSFMAVRSRDHQEALCRLARSLARPAAGEGEGKGASAELPRRDLPAGEPARAAGESPRPRQRATLGERAGLRARS